MSDRYLRDEKHQLLNSIGSELCWGWSPAIDFALLLGDRVPVKDTLAPAAESTAGGRNEITQTDKPRATATESSDMSELDALLSQMQRNSSSTSKAKTSSSSEPAVHVLLAGACDIRHIFRTAATLRLRAEEEKKKRRAEDAGETNAAATAPTYHFYVYEPNLRVHCRHLFFLQWLLDSTFSLEQLEERVLMFLDAYGNSCMREITAAQSRGVVQRVLRGLQNEETWNLYPMVSFEEMKLKERDFIEQQLIHWARDASRADITEQWSHRVRQEMAERYDNRDNIIDWDFVFRLTDYTNLLKFPEYRVWRNSGIAFDVCHINPRRGFTYAHTVPNKSLCHFDRRGNGAYCGDVKNGPFYALGAQTSNEFIRHRTADGTCKYGNGVVAMHNVRAWLYSLMTGTAWPWADHAFAWDDEKHYNYLPPGTPSSVEYHAEFPPVCIHLVGLDFDRLLLHVKEGKVPRFDAAFFGTSCTQLMGGAFLADAMAPHGVVVAETAKFVVDAEEQAKEAYMEKIVDMANASGWQQAEALTASLHVGQPEPRTYEGELTKAQKLSLKHYTMPFQVVFTKKSASA